MGNEFINVYVQKQKNLITELQSRLLIAEAQLEVTADQLKAATLEVENLKQELGNAKTSKK